MGGDHWTEYLLTEILLRLPIKSLVRFRWVAKTWRSLLQNPRFVSQHLSISKRKNRQLLVYYRQDTEAILNPKPLLRLFQLDQSLVSYQDFPPKDPLHIHLSHHFCVYDGLLCIYDFSTLGLTLCNPATREYRLLPPFPRKRKLPRKIIVEIGFGWDSSSNDYKAICMWRDSKQCAAEAAVYSMSSNSWRMLKDVEAIKNLCIAEVRSNGNTFVNGVYYWKVFETPCNKVLAFHFGDEVFQLIDWPSAGPGYLNGGKLLPLPHEGRISIWTHQYNGSSVANEVWVLNDYGRSWSKLLKIGPLQGIRMFGFWNGVNKVLVKSLLGQHNLSVYDLDTKEFRYLGANGIVEVYTYEESLVPIKL